MPSRRAPEWGVGSIGSGLLDAPQSLFPGVGEDGALPARDAVGGKEAGDGLQVRLGGVIHIHIGPAVGVDIQKAGGNPKAAGVDNGLSLPGGKGGGELGNNAVCDAHIGRKPLCVRQHRSAADQHGSGTHSATASVMRMSTSERPWRRLTGNAAVRSP